MEDRIDPITGEKIDPIQDIEYQYSLADKLTKDITAAAKASDWVYHLHFVDIKEFPLPLLNIRMSDRFVVMFRSGALQMIPSGIKGIMIKSYLGLRYATVTHWAPLPPLQSKNYFNSKNNSKHAITDKCCIYDNLYERHQK